MMIRPQAKVANGIILLGLLLLLLPGCEKRVVAVRDPWSHADPEFVEVKPESRRGPLEQVGQWLFGWTRVFASKDPQQSSFRPHASSGPSIPGLYTGSEDK